MPIKIKKNESGLYSASVTPPDGGYEWSSPTPMPIDKLIDQMRDLGCHTTDISDAFYEADPLWLQPQVGEKESS